MENFDVDMTMTGPVLPLGNIYMGLVSDPRAAKGGTLFLLGGTADTQLIMSLDTSAEMVADWSWKIESTRLPGSRYSFLPIVISPDLVRCYRYERN